MPVQGVAAPATRLPLRPYCNPISAHADSLGVFHCSQAASYPLLQKIFQETIRFLPWPRQKPFDSLSADSTQGRLLCTQQQTEYSVYAPHCRFKPVPYKGRYPCGSSLCTKTGLHIGRVGFSMPLEIALPTQAIRFPPASTPNWAFKADTRGFTVMPFKGFLGPS